MMIQNQAVIKSERHTRRAILSVVGVLAFVVIFFVGMFVGYAAKGTLVPGILETLADGAPDAVDFSPLYQTWDRIHEDYVGENVSDQDLLYGAIQGLVGSLDDPYSAFMTPQEAQDFQESITGTFEGIGAEIGFNDSQQLTVIAPLSDSPAFSAGLLSGDVILTIDGITTEGLTLDEAVAKIRGQKGTTVVLKIARENSEPQDITITRDTIKISSVTSEVRTVGNKNIAYMAVAQFNDDTAVAVSEGIADLLLKKPDGFVLDLRNNPGGLLTSAVEISGHFIGEKTVLIEEFSDGTQTPHASQTPGSITEIPVVVLVNEGSASASEIVAGALQDHKAATIVGAQTFGKGSVQDVMEFGDNSLLKLTIARWLTPNGTSITHNGITPDAVVEITDDDRANKRDPQLEKAYSLLGI